MKGPNPFSPWAAAQKELAGRKPETDMYSSILKDISGKRPAWALVTGEPGTGKSALLAFFSHMAEKQRFFSLLVKAGEGEKAEGLLRRIRAELANYLEGKAADGTISQRVMKSISSKEDISSAAKAIARHAEGLVILIDDVNMLRDPKKLFSICQMAMKQVRLGFILSSSRDFGQFEGIKIKLKEFDEHDAHEMIGKALGKGPPKMGEGCFATLLKESGGNPKVLATMCFVLYDRLGEKEKIITRRHYIVNSSAVMGMLARDFFDPLWQQLPAGERKVIAAFAEEKGAAHISDIAKKLGMRHATTLALRLAERGQLVRVDRGIYRVFTRLYGRYALQRS